MPKPNPAPQSRAGRRSRPFQLGLIAVLLYGALWYATFQIGLWQLASSCKMDPGKATWMELPGGHVRVQYFDESGKEISEEGFRVSCPCPFFIGVIDDASPKCSMKYIWFFGLLKPFNQDEYERCCNTKNK